jgi:hypothetical protein
MKRVAIGAALAVTLTLQAVALDRSASFHSDTVDESTYLAASTRMVRFGRDRVNREQPPLTKWFMAAALDAFEPKVRHGQRDSWEDSLWSHPPDRMMRNLRVARWVNIGFSLVTSLLLFGFLALRFGALSGLFASGLLACSPLFLAHSSIATLDAGAALTTLLVTLMFWLWLERSTRIRACAVALSLTLAMLAKSTALILPIPALAVVAWRIRKGWNWRRPIAELAVIGCLLTPLSLWASYDFQVVRLTQPALDHGLHDHLANLVGGRRVLKAVVPAAGLPVPLYDYLSGVGFQAMHARGGHHSFLNGEIRHRGWRTFYLHSIAYETPLIGLVFGLLGLVLLWRRRLPIAAYGLLVLPAWWLIYFSLITPAQGGLKYLLPGLPLWVGYLGVCLAWVWKRSSIARPALAAAFLLLAFSVHRFGPNYLMFFNPLAGGPQKGWAHLVHGKDWGQGQRQLGEWQKKNQVKWIWYARYHGQPKSWGIRYRKPPCEPVIGWVAAHVSELQRPERHVPVGCLDWLKSQEPVGHFGHSILLWNIRRLSSMP